MLYDGQSLIAEYDNGNSLLRRYVHGPGVDEPLVWYEGTGTSDRRFYHADERGSIVATSNSSGAMLTVNSYDEYGIPGSGNSGRFQYTGQQWLGDIGMYHYRARIYSPTFGRFLQTDPIGLTGGMNLYAYVGNDPSNLVDPSGLLPAPPPPDPCSNPDNCGTVTGPRRICAGGLIQIGNVCVSGADLDTVTFSRTSFSFVTQSIPDIGRGVDCRAQGRQVTCQLPRRHQARPDYCFSLGYKGGQVLDGVGRLGQRGTLALAVFAGLMDGPEAAMALAPTYLHFGNVRAFGYSLQVLGGRPVNGYDLVHVAVPRMLGLDVLGEIVVDAGMGAVGKFISPPDPC